MATNLAVMTFLKDHANVSLDGDDNTIAGSCTSHQGKTEQQRPQVIHVGVVLRENYISKSPTVSEWTCNPG